MVGRLRSAFIMNVLIISILTPVLDTKHTLDPLPGATQMVHC